MLKSEIPDSAGIDKIGRPRSLASLATEQIRELIVTDKLKLGQQLSEAGLAEQLGISRTPVRDALVRLQAERLVEIKPQLGSYVFRYDAKQLHSILELREILEVGALRIALGAHRGLTLNALNKEVASGEVAVRAGVEAYQAADTAFHSAILVASHNPELIDAYSRISGRIRAIRFRAIRNNARFETSQRDHAAILAAIKASDDEGAAKTLARHVYNSYFGYLEDLGQPAGIEHPPI
jgi:DNA-binding GntR family transcriptional regulator